MRRLIKKRVKGRIDRKRGERERERESKKTKRSINVRKSSFPAASSVVCPIASLRRAKQILHFLSKASLVRQGPLVAFLYLSS